MNIPKVSVIIPTYNGSRLLGNAIQSVLEQTYTNYELIIVNDASPDNTSEVVKDFHDSRIKYIVRNTNQGVDKARCTGISLSHGEIIAFLDQDDFYHPEKLESHVVFLEKHPNIGFSYNARFELNYSVKTIRDIWRPSRNITLSDLVLWFPIAPSDWVLRRTWALELLSIMKSSKRWTGGEIVYLGDLFMKGCKFALVNRALNYRWHHSGRIFRDLDGGCSFEIAAQQEVLSDARCTQDVLALRDTANSNIYMFWAYRAFVQEATELGQNYLRKAIQLKPSLLSGSPCELLTNLLINCCDDEKMDHSILLEKIFAQLPIEASDLLNEYEWAVARGYLIKGARAFSWSRFGIAREYFQKAKSMGAKLDQSFLEHLAQKILDYEIEFGNPSSRMLLAGLVQAMGDAGISGFSNRLRGMIEMHSAFRSFHERDFSIVPRRFLQAIFADSRLLLNRGLISISLRSILYIIFKDPMVGSDRAHESYLA